MQNDLSDLIYPLKDYVTPKNIAIAGGALLLLSICGMDPTAILVMLCALWAWYMFYQRADESSTPVEA